MNKNIPLKTWTLSHKNLTTSLLRLYRERDDVLVCSLALQFLHEWLYILSSSLLLVHVHPHVYNKQHVLAIDRFRHGEALRRGKLQISIFNY